MNKISIKFTVVSLFAFFGALIISIMLYLQYTFSQQLVKSAMNEQINLLSSKVKDSISHMNANNSNLINSISDFLDNKNFEHFQKDQKKYIQIFTNILKNNPNLYAIYIGFEDDSFFEIINLNIDNNLKMKYNAQAQDFWLLVEINNNVKKLSLLNKHLEITNSQVLNNDYKATSRPWYKKALINNSVIKTDPYQFSNISAKGITYSKIISNTKNVFSLDILVNDLNNILDSFSGKILENSFLLNSKGKIITDSSKEKNNKIFAQITQNIKEKETAFDILKDIEIDGEEYIYSIVLINDEYLCSYAKVEQIIKPYKEKFKYMFFITIFIFLLMFPLIFYFSSIIVNPILLLVRESKKVKNRDFDKLVKVDTKVLEVSTLSLSLIDMSESIYEYQRDLEKKVQERTIQLDEKNKELERLAITDKLTGLYNRIKLDETIEIEMQRANRYNTIFGIILIDIDFFKSVNDIYGHQVGDTILQEFSSILQKSIRKIDIVGRWGGEEFMIICPEMNIKDIIHIAEKLRIKIEQFKFTKVNNKTASFGVTIYKKGEKLEEMMHRADQALYIAKEKGRNKVESL